MEAVVAAAERRGRRGVRRHRWCSPPRRARRVEIGGVRRAEDDVDGAAAVLGRGAGHRRADGDVGEAVAVDVVADDRVAEHLAPVAADRERGRAEVERGRRRGQRAGLAEEDVDDAGVGAAADVGGGQADRVVAEAVAVDVAELGDGRARAVAVVTPKTGSVLAGSAPLPTLLEKTPTPTIAAATSPSTSSGPSQHYLLFAGSLGARPAGRA